MDSTVALPLALSAFCFALLGLIWLFQRIWRKR